MARKTVGDRPVPALERIPYPSHPALKFLFKAPLFLWRIGLGPLVGRLFLILTTWGRKSGLPRYTPVEYHVVDGRPHVMAAWPQSDWYRNLQANPHVTIQTSTGTRRAIARRLTDDAELAAVYEYAEAHPMLRCLWESMGIDLTREAFLEQKERFRLLTFEPTGDPTPPPLQADLWWVWPLGVAFVVLVRLWRSRTAE